MYQRCLLPPVIVDISFEFANSLRRNLLIIPTIPLSNMSLVGFVLCHTIKSISPMVVLSLSLLLSSEEVMFSAIVTVGFGVDVFDVVDDDFVSEVKLNLIPECL